MNVGTMFFNSQKQEASLQKELELNLDLSFPIAVAGASNVGKSTLLDTECGEFGILVLLICDFNAPFRTIRTV